MNSQIQPVVLCGGSGTRLWPLSRKAFPKQFVPIIEGKSLLALTLERLAPFCEKGTGGVICVGAEDHRFLIGETMREAKVSGSIILEPCARGTAAAMALAALNAAQRRATAAVLPGGPSHPRRGRFRGDGAQRLRAAPSRAPSSRLGWCPAFPAPGTATSSAGDARADGGYDVKRFIEKPKLQFAQELSAGWQGLLERRHLSLHGRDACWPPLEQHAPDIVARCREAMAAPQPDGNFLRPAAAPLEACRSESIDYAVMERHAKVAVFPFQRRCGATWAAGRPWPTCTRATTTATALKGRA